MIGEIVIWSIKRSPKKWSAIRSHITYWLGIWNRIWSPIRSKCDRPDLDRHLVALWFTLYVKNVFFPLLFDKELTDHFFCDGDQIPIMIGSFLEKRSAMRSRSPITRSLSTYKGLKIQENGGKLLTHLLYFFIKCFMGNYFYIAI